MIEPMKAITIWQPWASLLACGAKKYETRSWATKYRGPIAIHAATRHPDWFKRDTYGLSDMESALCRLWGSWGIDRYDDLPRGCIIATAELVGCRKIYRNPYDAVTYILDDTYAAVCIEGDELLFGDWTPGRYAWELANVKMLDTLIPAKGRQGLWNWEGVA